MTYTPDSPLRILSLGAGVQSSTLALMAARGEVQPPHYAIFADTGNEPRHTVVHSEASGVTVTGGVYGWLDWLEQQLPFPVIRVQKGVLFDDAVVVRTSSKSGKRYMKGLVPAFIKAPDGSQGLLGRHCTADYKITVIQREVRRLLGVRNGPRDVRCTCMIGISYDEVMRMKSSRVPYIRNEWPLVDLRMTRMDCLDWLKQHGYPAAPRSACVGCPFHSDEEWKHLKETSPQDFEAAVTAERKLQQAAERQNLLVGVPYLHRSMVNLDTVEFSTGPGYVQLTLFGEECSGMCGV